MAHFIPTAPWACGKEEHPQFFLCVCEKCGFRQAYEVTDQEVVLSEEGVEASEPIVVKVLPRCCPKCGGALKNTRIPKALKSS